MSKAINDVYKEVMSMKDKSLKDKLNMFIDGDDVDLSNLSKVLLEYEETMVKGVDSTIGSRMNINLCNTLLGIIKHQDEAVFNTLFKLVNVVFNNFKETAYDEIMMHRFAEDWSDGMLLNTYQILVTTICLLCDPINRETNKKRISLTHPSKGYVLEDTHLTVENLNRLEHYYGIK